MTSDSGIPITLAFQGGGTHGAFAWGAADQLLLDGRCDVRAITATSGGAMTAVVMADALIRGGKEEAREHLTAFWRKVSIAASMLPIRTTLMDKMLSNVGIDISASTIALDYLTKLFSPYQFNLFDLNPLRAIVEEMVDFEQLRKQKDIQLFINATEVNTGRGRVFTAREISLDVVMASSCLPFIFKTVVVNGQPYWDGGYTGNPAISPLVDTEVPRDVILLQSASAQPDEIPTQAPDILDRATEISFHHALMADLKAAEAVGKLHPERALRLHVIESSEMMGGLGRASKLNADWEFLSYLHDLGAQAAQDFLAANAGKLGSTGTADVKAMCA